MKSIQNILQDNGREFLDDIMNNYVIVYEKLNASTLSFSRRGDELKFYKGRDNEEITQVNSALYSYFQDGIDYIKRVSMIFYREFPEGWMFRMQYFVQNDTNLIEYDYMPQNNLILSCIDTGSTIIEDPDALKKWAERLLIDYSQPVYQGFLTEIQKERIRQYVDGGGVPEGVPFSQYIISILNPQSNHSAYRNGFGGIDSFIFKFYKPNSKKCVCAKLVDPYMEELIKSNKGDFGANDGCENEIVLANFIAFLKTVDLKDVEVKGDNDDERYMDMICRLFNMYVDKNNKILKDINGSVKESFTVNIDKIPNKETAEILTKNPNLSTAFQIIVGTFMNKKDPNATSAASIFDKDLIDTFNDEVSAIKRHTSENDEQVKTFDELMKTSMNKSIEQAAEESETKKVMSFTELMKSIGEEIKDGDDDDNDGHEEKKEEEHKEEKSEPEEKDEEKKEEEKSEPEEKDEEKKEEEKSEEKKEDEPDKSDTDSKEGERDDENKSEDSDTSNEEKSGDEEENGKESKDDESKSESDETKDDESDNSNGDDEKSDEKSDESESGKSEDGNTNSSDESKPDDNGNSDSVSEPAEKDEAQKAEVEGERQEPEKTAPEPKSGKPEKKEKEEKTKPEPKQNNNGGGADNGDGGLSL